MDYLFCPNCNSQRGFKRALGFGTLFIVVLTIGVWLFAIPFYPKRCIVCGQSKTATRHVHAGSKSGLAWFLLAVIAVIAVLSMNKTAPPILKPIGKREETSLARAPSSRKSLLRSIADEMKSDQGAEPQPPAASVGGDNALPPPEEFQRAITKFSAFIHKPGGEGYLRLLGIQTRKGLIPLPSVPVTERSIPGITPMPTIQDDATPGCGDVAARRACTDEELAEQTRYLIVSWSGMPESYRQRCLSKNTLSTMFRCIGDQKIEFLSKHLGEELTQLAIQNPWLYENDQHGNPVQPAPGPLFLPSSASPEEPTKAQPSVAQ